MNYKEHPASFAGTEDLAYGYNDRGEHEKAMQLAKAWIAKHPDHKNGLQLISELQR